MYNKLIMFRNLRILIIGCGTMANIHMRVLKNYVDSKNIFCHDSNELVLDQFVNFNNVNKFKNEKGFDGIIISTPTNTHLEVYEMYKSISNFFFIEKPLVNNYSELIALGDSDYAKIYCGFIETHNKIFSELLNTIQNQKIVSIQITRHSPKIENERISSNVDLDLAIHDLSVLLKYFLDIDKVNNLNNIKNFKPNNFYETSEIHLTDGNIIASISTSRITNKKIRFWRVVTDLNTYEIDLLKNTITQFAPAGEYKFINSVFSQNLSRNEKLISIPEPADVQMKQFLNSIINKKIDNEDIKIIKKAHLLLLN